MLEWSKHPDGWHAEGYHIELPEPFRWLVFDEADDDSEPSAVSLGVQPLATARTLTEAKREAKILATARRRDEVRRKQLLTMLTALSCAALLWATPSSGSVLLVIGAAGLAVRSAAVLLGTLMPTAFGEQHQAFYQ